MAKIHNEWFCANHNCSNVLGVVSAGELVINLDNVMNINTDGTALAVLCKKCGNIKVWYPNAESSLLGAWKSLKRDLVRR